MTRRRLVDWAALPITDRRWAAPLSAIALGFGLFVGVAISPSAAGTMATGAPALLLEVAGDDQAKDEQRSEDPIADRAAAAGDLTGRSGDVPTASFPGASGSTASTPSSPSVTAPSPPAAPPSAPADSAPEEDRADELLTGTVVHVNPAAASYTLAEEGGALSVVHAGRRPQPGTELEVPVRALANGTFAEAGRRQRTGSARRASLLGTVTFVSADPLDPAYVLSGRGVSVVVHVHFEAGGAVPMMPTVGTLVGVEVSIDTSTDSPTIDPTPAPTADEGPVQPPTEAGCPSESPPGSPVASAAPERLWQRDIEEKGDPGAYAELAALVVAVCPQQEQLVLSADDSDQLSARLALGVPVGFDLSKLAVGESVTATASIADGAFTLAGIASDERLEGAEDRASAQGDLRR